MLLLPMPWIASAAGLGKLAVLSSLGQPFRAEIDLVLHEDELAALSSRIASPGAYKQANFQYGSALAGLRLNVKQQPNGRAYVEITSSRPVNEPFIDLLIELNGESTHIIRGYTVLIDPPGFGPTPSTSARVAVPEARPASGAQSAASRKITARVEDKTAASKAKNVARLFKGKSPNVVTADAGKTHSLSYRLHILEDKSILQTRTLAELIKRISLAEGAFQGIQQRLVEIKNQDLAAAQKRAEVEALAHPPEAIKPKVAAVAEPERAPVPVKKEEPKTAAAPEKPAVQAKPEKPESKISPPPPPESSLVSSVFGEPLYLAMGGGLILLGGLAFWMKRRRQLQELTPEDILNKLLIRDPSRDDIQIKLLEIYAARDDQAAFDSAATKFNELTGGQGEDWLKVAAMGYALDPGNPLYEAGKNPVTAETDTETNTDTITDADIVTNLDLDLDVDKDIKEVKSPSIDPSKP